MKIPYYYNCDKCGIKRTHWAHVNDQSVNHRCKCGYKSQVHITSNITIGVKLIYRAGFELAKRRDYDSSIIFSAMAYETEQMRLYQKWYELDSDKYIDPLKANQYVRDVFRNLGNMRKKINNTMQQII